MARILYSCCGEGQGHSSRVLTVTRALIELGHEVKILASHKAFEVLQPHLPDVREIPGFTFVYRHNRVELVASFRGNLPLLRQRGRIIREIRDLIESWQPQLAITDFEPFLPRAAKLSGLRCISLDHQGVIPHARPKLPLAQMIPALAARTVVRLTGHQEEARLATSFFYPPAPPVGNVQFFPPILREKVLRITPRDDGYVVVYQTSSSFTRLPEQLKHLPFQFKVFAFEHEGADGNISYFPRSDTRFIEEVGGASWVLTNGGYTLMSEALFLGKPVFSLPVAWQFEQWLNARYLQDLGYGWMCDDLREFEVKLWEFLGQLDVCRANILRQNFFGNELALARIQEFLPAATSISTPLVQAR
ncbi:MAG TPA: glycosyltransferase family protein [Verrucomicrobiae bacterium]|nr:glycosyltransferase family protein [Verrucomicrobiae bacterium]